MKRLRIYFSGIWPCLGRVRTQPTDCWWTDSFAMLRKLEAKHQPRLKQGTIEQDLTRKLGELSGEGLSAETGVQQATPRTWVSRGREEYE